MGRSLALTMLLAMAIGLRTSDALAEDQARVYGSGNSSCGRWTATRGVDSKRQPTEWVEHLVMEAWTQGFVTGAGAMGSSQKETDSSAIELWIDQYCSQHPLETIHDTAVHLVVALGGARKQ